MKSRSLHYDLLRIIACIMVIMTHSPIPHSGWSGPVLSGLSYFCAPCIGLFFMISGALLLNREYSFFYFSEFLKKRFARVFFPTFFFYIIGYTMDFYGIKNSEIAILWFMFVLSGLYLLIPILYRWTINANKREIEFYLMLWVISLLYPLFKLFVDLNESDTSWIYYFHGYVGYFILGFYLAKYGTGKLINIGLIVAFLIFSIGFPLLNLVFNLNVDFYSCFGYLSISVVLICVVWWLSIKRISGLLDSIRPIVEFLSKYSFGIYLIHILVMRNFLWELSFMQSLQGVSQILFCSLLTFIITLFICWLISKFRFSKYIIGV